MISVEEALTRCFDLVTVLPVETVPLRHAAGRFMAEPAVARRDQPPFDASAMDGYAVAGDPKAGDSFAVIGEAGAGHVVLHVVRQGMREDDVGAGLADDRSDLAHDLDVEGQRHVVDDGRIELRAEEAGGESRLPVFSRAAY